VPPAEGVGTVRFPGSAAALTRVLYGLVGVLALLVLAGATWAFRRTRASRVPPAAALPADLIGALARLDARYAGKQDVVPAAEWSAYVADRARLKAAALARGRIQP
jgi:hypothetical protein